MRIGGAGHPDPEIRGGPVSKKSFSALRVSFWSKNKAGARAPPLNPPRGWIFLLTGRWDYYYTGGFVSWGEGCFKRKRRLVGSRLSFSDVVPEV